MPSPLEIDVMVATVIKHAAQLREAGVLRFSLDDLAVEFAPHTPEHEAVTDDTPTQVVEKKSSSMWNDPDLYGLPENAKVPGLRKDE